MLAPPNGLTDEDVAVALLGGWSLAPESLTYAPVGFGSHHWIAGDHFVTVDDLADASGLEAALRTARALRDDADLPFVIAATPAADGALLVPVGGGWVMHVYERLDVVDDTTFGPHDDPEVLDLVRQVHGATERVGHHADHEDFSIWARDDLEEALGDLDEPWETGPFAKRARQLLAAHADDVSALFAIHDRLAADVARSGWVVTHGEPHRGNIFRTTNGWAIVDWDTALVAPAERDLWSVPGDHGDPERCLLYRLRWDLTEIAVYVAGFYDEHPGDANDDQSWAGFLEYIDLRRRWPQLLRSHDDKVGQGG